MLWTSDAVAVVHASQWANWGYWDTTALAHSLLPWLLSILSLRFSSYSCDYIGMGLHFIILIYLWCTVIVSNVRTVHDSVRRVEAVMCSSCIVNTLA
jgi:hypothetical protein